MNLTDYGEIQNLLARHGFHFSKSLGQNFLTSYDVIENIVKYSGVDGDTTVLEIGPGIGCLTVELSKAAKKVVSVEADRSLMPILAETLSGCENVEVVFADALKYDLSSLGASKVCANLPYSITSPILTKLIKTDSLESITVMIQREVAQRICASAGENDYSAFGIFTQWNCEVEHLFDVPPECFVPKPKVTSSVIRLTRRAKNPAEVSDEELMFKIIRAAFNMRRKTLVNAVASNISGVDKNSFADVLEKCGFDSRIRGEVLTIGDFAKITDELSNIL